MNGRIYQITREQFQLMANPSFDQAEAADLSTRILVGIYANQPLVYVGLIPLTLLDDSAYMWSIVRPEAAEHKVIFGRHAKAVVARILEFHPRLIGHCFTESSARWLRSLGATFLTDTEFEIRRA